MRLAITTSWLFARTWVSSFGDMLASYKCVHGMEACILELCNWQPLSNKLPFSAQAKAKVEQNENREVSFVFKG